MSLDILKPGSSQHTIVANDQFTLGLDIDDTICITSSVFTKALQEKGYDIKEENKDASRWYNSSTGGVSKEVEEQVFVDFIKSGAFLDLKVIPGVVELLTKFKEDGIRIVLITARPEEQLGEITKEWLAKNEIPYDALYFSEDKGSIAKKEGVDSFVDDDLKNAFDKRKVVMISQPWNKEYEGKRIESLKELEELIKKPKTVMQQLKRNYDFGGNYLDRLKKVLKKKKVAFEMPFEDLSVEYRPEAGKCPVCGQISIGSYRHRDAPVFCVNQHHWNGACGHEGCENTPILKTVSLKRVSHIMPREPVSEDTDLSGGYIERMKKKLKPIKALLEDLHVFKEEEVIYDQIMKELRKKRAREELERRQKNQNEIPTEKIVRKMASLESVRRAERQQKMQKLTKALLLDDLRDMPMYRDLKNLKEFESNKDFNTQVYESLRKKREHEDQARRRKNQNEISTESFVKNAFLVKKLKLVATCFKKATKEYYTLEEMLETLVYGIPDLKIEMQIGEKKDFAGCEKESLPFAYGEIPNFTNSTDEMSWDIIVLPSAINLTKEEMIPVGVLRYNRDPNFWEGKIEESPIGNDKILLGKRESQGTEGGIGIYTQDDVKALSDFLVDKPSFESPEFFFKVEE
jgi:uncharacterized HAD superfamily protein